MGICRPRERPPHRCSALIGSRGLTLIRRALKGGLVIPFLGQRGSMTGFRVNVYPPTEGESEEYSAIRDRVLIPLSLNDPRCTHTHDHV
jgi:hypothetical protein